MYDFKLSESLVPAQTDAEVRDITIGGLLREVAAQRGDHTALVEIDLDGNAARSWTYMELLTESEILALALAARFHPGERITVWSPNSPEWVFMEFACALAGIILVPANPTFQARELRHVIEHSGSVALFLVPEFGGNPMAEIGAQACKGLDAIREIIDLTDGRSMYMGSDITAGLALLQAGDAAMIQYTSGTTGLPKGVVLAHRGLINNARFYAERLHTHADTIWANIVPMYQTSSCGLVTLGCLQAGCKMLIVPVFDPSSICRLIEREKVSTILSESSQLVALLEALQQERHNVSSVRMFSSGGAKIAPELVRNIQQVFGCEFSSFYGQTETSPVITQHHTDDSLDDIRNTIGQPLPQTEVSIRSSDDNQVVALDTVGEICVKAYCNMIEYHGNRVATRETIDDQGWLHTGDLGTMDERGYLRISGRVKGPTESD